MSLIEPQHVTVSNPLRSIGFYIKKERSKWETTLHTTRMSNLVDIEIFMLKSNQLFDDRELVFEKKRGNMKGKPFLWVSGEKWKFFMYEWGWVGAGVSIFWLREGDWTFFEGGCGWVEVYSGWVGVGRHFLWVGGGGWTFFMGGWGWMHILGGGIFWVSGAGWTFFMGGWGWMEVYFGWVGVRGLCGGGHSF